MLKVWSWILEIEKSYLFGTNHEVVASLDVLSAAKMCYTIFPSVMNYDGLSRNVSKLHNFISRCCRLQWKKVRVVELSFLAFLVSPHNYLRNNWILTECTVSHVALWFCSVLHKRFVGKILTGTPMWGGEIALLNWLWYTVHLCRLTVDSIL